MFPFKAMASGSGGAGFGRFTDRCPYPRSCWQGFGFGNLADRCPYLARMGGNPADRCPYLTAMNEQGRSPGRCPALRCPDLVHHIHGYPRAQGGGFGHRYGFGKKGTRSDGDFHVSLNVAGYDPDDLEVKVLGQEVTVHGKQEAHREQPGDPGTISREFTRYYELGDDIDPQTVASSLSYNELTITATKKVPAGEPRVVSIETAGGSGDE